MACIKSVNRSASTVFAPDAPYLASGTMAGAVDLSFSSSANLEIFKLDFTSDDRELPLVGEAPSTERFNRLSWGKAGSETEEYPLGLIAGGLVDGNVSIWNPHKLISSKTADGLVARTQEHAGPVLGLEFNSNSPNLLASGAVEGEISIWDFANVAEPFHYPSLRSATGPQGEITYLSWNHVVDKILASTSSTGKIVVWDLRRQKPAITFTDPDKKRCSVLQWSPDAATQIIVASDDDSSPDLKLWDVRNTIAPVKWFKGHSKGVIAMSWCPIDSSFLLTCAKDNQTICWDTVTGEMVSELPIGTNWNFDVHWHLKIPGLVSASSFDGKIGIYNIETRKHLQVITFTCGQILYMRQKHLPATKLIILNHIISHSLLVTTIHHNITLPSMVVSPRIRHQFPRISPHMCNRRNLSPLNHFKHRIPPPCLHPNFLRNMYLSSRSLHLSLLIILNLGSSIQHRLVSLEILSSISSQQPWGLISTLSFTYNNNDGTSKSSTIWL